MTTDEPWRHQRATQDRRTRRAVAMYAVRALGLVALGLALLIVAGLVLTDGGDTRPGVPKAVPFVLIPGGMLSGLFGLFSLLNLVRITWVVARYPWAVERASFEEVGGGNFISSVGTPNGEPTLTLRDGPRSITLTLVALRWRWARFAQAELLFAGRIGRSGVVATLDRGAILWAGRSLFDRMLLDP